MIKNSLKYLLLALLISSGLMAQVQVGSPILGTASGDYFGVNTAINGNGTIVAGFSVNHDPNKGHVRVYQYTPTGNASWTQMGNDIDGEAAGDHSGRYVSLSSDGSTVCLRAYGNDGNGSASGHVRVYNWNGTSWNQLGQDIDGEVALDLSGYSVSLSSDGSTVAIGSHQNDGNGSNSGHVRLYNFDGSNWNQLGNDIDGEAADDYSGWSVSPSISLPK
jgi:hypothetical protein